MITVKHDTTTNTEIQKNGLNALKESLGVTGMLRFLEQFDHGGSGDYTTEKYKNEEDQDTKSSLYRVEFQFKISDRN